MNTQSAEWIVHSSSQRAVKTRKWMGLNDDHRFKFFTVRSLCIIHPRWSSKMISALTKFARETWNFIELNTKLKKASQFPDFVRAQILHQPTRIRAKRNWNKQRINEATQRAHWPQVPTTGQDKDQQGRCHPSRGVDERPARKLPVGAGCWGESPTRTRARDLVTRRAQEKNQSAPCDGVHRKQEREQVRNSLNCSEVQIKERRY